MFLHYQSYILVSSQEVLPSTSIYWFTHLYRLDTAQARDTRVKEEA